MAELVGAVARRAALAEDGGRLDDGAAPCPLAERIHHTYFHALTRYARRQGALDPESAANAAVYAGWRAQQRNPIDDEAAFRSYLYRAARSHSLNQLRRPEPVPTGVVGDRWVEPDECDEVVQREWLNELLRHLPEDQRAVLDLRIVQGYSAAEAGRILNRRPNAVYQLQHRAQQHLLRLVLAALVLALLASGVVVALRDGGATKVESSPITDSLIESEPVPTLDDESSGVRSLVVDTGPTPATTMSAPPQTGTAETEINDGQAKAEPAPSTTVEALTTTGQPTTEKVSSSSTAKPADLAEAPGAEASSPVSTSEFNMCVVQESGNHTWVKLYQPSNGERFEPPSAIRLTITDESGLPSTIEVHPGQPNQLRHGWVSEDGTLSNQGEPGSNWGIKLGSLNVELLAVEVGEGDTWTKFEGCRSN